jgi:hypothetical protein
MTPFRATRFDAMLFDQEQKRREFTPSPPSGARITKAPYEPPTLITL